ncbi:MAG: DUF5915 domain-containing protein, partial [Patescibacteria group bacterium]
LAEHIYKQVGGEELSVHLDAWPELAGSLDEAVLTNMARVRQIVSVALEQRASAGINVRQALAKMTVTADAVAPELVEIIQDEVNVKSVEFVSGGELAVTLDTTMTPELLREGRIREIIRMGNAARKAAGLTIEDRIILKVATGDVAGTTKAIEEHRTELLEGTRANDVIIEEEVVQVLGVTIEKV